MKRNVEHHIFQLTLPTSNQWEQHRQILSYALKAAQRFFFFRYKNQENTSVTTNLLYLCSTLKLKGLVYSAPDSPGNVLELPLWPKNIHYFLISKSDLSSTLLQAQTNTGQWQNFLFQSSCCCLVANVVWFPCWTSILQPHPLSYILWTCFISPLSITLLVLNNS